MALDFVPRNRCIRASMRRRSAASAWLSASPPHVGTWRRLARTAQAARTSSPSAALPPRPAIRTGRGGALRAVSTGTGCELPSYARFAWSNHARLHVSVPKITFCNNGTGSAKSPQSILEFLSILNAMDSDFHLAVRPHLNATPTLSFQSNGRGCVQRSMTNVT
jgi:hypothetical protein